MFFISEVLEHKGQRAKIVIGTFQNEYERDRAFWFNRNKHRNQIVKGV
jgi:hypothetical protein